MPFGWPLSWPITVPTLPSLNGIGTSFSSLFATSQWQRRLLVYLVRRSLSGILVLPEDDIEQSTFLTADLSSGNVQLRQLQLDTQSLNERIKSTADQYGLDIALRSGTIGSVELLLGDKIVDDDALHSRESTGATGAPAASVTSGTTSATDRLFNAPIQLAVTDVELVIYAKPKAPYQDKGKRASTLTHDAIPDLEASILHVAQDYLHQSILSQPSHNAPLDIEEQDDDPFSLPGAFASSSSSNSKIPLEKEKEQVGLIASLIERLLARLQVRIQNVQVKLFLEDEVGNEDIILQFRTKRVESGTKMQEGSRGTSYVRSLDIVQPELWMQTPAAPAHRAKSTSSEGSRSSGSAKTPDSEDDMAMSMAIADLRHSDVSLHRKADTILGDSSEDDVSTEHEEMYFSTLAGAGGDISQTGLSRSSPTPSNEALQEDPTDMQDEEKDLKMVFSLFPQTSDSSANSSIAIRFVTSIPPKAPSNAVSPEQEPSRKLSSASQQLEISLPVVGIRLDAAQILALSRWTSRLVMPSSSPIATAKPPSPAGSSSTAAILTHFKMNAAHIYLDLETLDQSLQSYIALTNTGKTLHFFLEGAEGAYRSPASEGKLAIREYGLLLGEDGQVTPLVLPNPGMAWSYPVNGLSPGQQILTRGDWAARLKTSRVEEWQTPVPANSSSMKVDTKAAILNDALAVRVKETEVGIILQPVHIWVDFQILERLLPLLDLVNTVNAATAGKASLPDEGISARGDMSQQTSGKTVTVSTAVLRLDIRCPNPASKELRSGIVTLDIWDIAITRPANPSPTLSSDRPRQTKSAAFEREKDDTAPSGTTLFTTTFKSSYVLFCKTSQTRKATCIVSLEAASAKRAPTVRLLQDWQGNEQSKTLHCHLPAVDLKLNQAAIHGLQYLADDLGQAIAHLGGSTAGSGDINESASSAAEGSPGGISIQVHIVQAVISLDIPSNSLENGRKLVLDASDINVSSGQAQKSSGLELKVSAGAGEFRDLSASPPKVIFRRLAVDRKIPLVSLGLISRVDPTTTGKHLLVKVVIYSILANLASDTAYVADLLKALQAPPGAFVNIEPGELTQIDLIVEDSMVRILPRTQSSALALQVKELRYATIIRNGQDVNRSTLVGNGLEVWLAAETAPRQEGEASLRSLGYAPLARVEALHVPLEQRAGSTEVTMEHIKAGLTACPDTLLVLAALLADFSPPSSPKLKPVQKPVADLSGSIIMPRKVDSSMSDNSVPQATQGSIVSRSPGETITVFEEGKINVNPDWFRKTPPTIQAAYAQEAVVKVRLHHSELTILLFEGYDFERTRKYVKDAVKATRRKLEKIRQLLAEGQIPEETVDEAADYLLQSVFLPPRRPSPDGSNTGEDLNTMDRIIAFDDELDQEDETASQSWETLPDRPAMRRTFSSSSAKPQVASASRLKRPKQSALDVRLDDLELQFDAYPPDHALVSRLALDIGNLNIVDNMKTSTWHKFLTELRPRDGGILRPTGSPMVRVLLKMLRNGMSEGEEATLKAQVSPLRLHVDQDALDFLKAFAAFKMEDMAAEASAAPVSGSQSNAPESGGFIQRVEVLPIKIKLDYKPKRVDYRALQKGNTIELMNFFHFEASEMVLRHLVLTGVPSWAKVGDMCQDIWTPDVKSNQLADFLAGINPVRSVVNVGGGVADLVLLPVQQYRKDGRLGRGVQKGTSRFAKTTALEAVKLGARLASGTQVILERAEHLIGGRDPGSATASRGSPDLVVEATDEDEDDEDYDDDLGNLGRKEALSKFAHQPTNAKEGMQSAYRSLSGNVKSAAETILAVPMEVYERSSEGPVRAVVRAVPVAVLRSGIGASQAVRETLLGLRNQMDPGAKEEIQDKYKRPSTSS